MSGLILASASAVRAALLRAAGVPFVVHTAEIDEAAAKGALVAGGTEATAMARALAERKAVSVSSTNPGAIVLGCDQALVFEGELVDKAVDMKAARARLLALRGKTHTLISAAVLARGGRPIWQAEEAVRLRMRAFSDAFLDAYLEHEGRDLLGSVGCYRFEDRGVQLFESVEGDYFAILGLPLMPLLAALREEGIIER